MLDSWQAYVLVILHLSYIRQKFVGQQCKTANSLKLLKIDIVSYCLIESDTPQRLKIRAHCRTSTLKSQSYASAGGETTSSSPDTILATLVPHEASACRFSSMYWYRL